MMKSILLAAVLCAATVFSVLAHAQTDTTFTYQGELKESGNAANGMYNIDFALFSSVAGGIQVGTTVSIIGQDVIDGLFSAQLDFGAQDFSSNSYWLEIVVDGNTLSPRVAMTGTPFSIQTRGIYANNDLSFVGVGRQNSITNSDFFGVHAPVNSGFGGMYVSTDSEVAWPFYGYAAGGSADAWHYYDGSTSKWHLNNGGDRLTIQADGNIGIGTVAPMDTLHVVSNGPRAIFAQNFSNIGETTGLWGQAHSISGRGVIGISTNAIGNNFGVWGQANGNLGRGVYGVASSDEGNPIGVLGETLSSGGTGVDGRAFSETGSTKGVFGLSNSPEGWAGYFIGEQSFFDCRVGIGGNADYPGAMLHISAFDEQPLVVEVDGVTRFKVEENGRVVVGSNLPPFFALEIGGEGTAGKPGGGSWSNSSDIRLKENIHTLEGTLDQLMKLRGVNFEYKDPEAIHELSGVRIGMIAQEVEAVFPDWVSLGGHGYKTLTYRGFEALTVEALRELRHEKDTQIEQLKDENQLLKARLDRLERLIARVID